MRKLFVSEKAIEKKGLDFFKNLECYDITYGHFDSFRIMGYSNSYKIDGNGFIKDGNLYFCDEERDEKVVFVKEINKH